MPERFKWFVPCKALYKCSALPLPLTEPPYQKSRHLVINKLTNYEVNKLCVYLVCNGHDMFVSGNIEVKDVEVVLGIQLIGDPDKRRASGLWNTIVYDDHVFFTVCRK